MIELDKQRDLAASLRQRAPELLGRVASTNLRDFSAASLDAMGLRLEAALVRRLSPAQRDHALNLVRSIYLQLSLRVSTGTATLQYTRGPEGFSELLHEIQAARSDAYLPLANARPSMDGDNHRIIAEQFLAAIQPALKQVLSIEITLNELDDAAGQLRQSCWAFKRHEPFDALELGVIEQFEAAVRRGTHRMRQRLGEYLIPFGWVPAEDQTVSAGVDTTLPETPPETWQGRKDRSENPPAFVRRVYGAWLRADGTGLTRPMLRRLDAPLYAALAKHIQRHGEPNDLHLPSKSALVDQRLESGSAADQRAAKRDEMARYRRRKK